jgi:hypothetical protein
MYRRKKSSLKMGATSVILPKEKKNSVGEKLPNLVTLSSR